MYYSYNHNFLNTTLFYQNPHFEHKRKKYIKILTRKKTEWDYLINVSCIVCNIIVSCKIVILIEFLASYMACTINRISSLNGHEFKSSLGKKDFS